MCRWAAYLGSPIDLGTMLFLPKHSLVHQSLEALQGAEPTNGDGFGVGWYTGATEVPGRYRSIAPAWNDPNLYDLSTHISSPVVFAHVRATTGTPVQHTNCHPFNHGRWLFMHNGVVATHDGLRRELMLHVAPVLWDSIAGGTDSELLFYLALTEGLDEDPLGALARALGLVERVAQEHGIGDPVQGTFAMTDGTTMWAARYSTAHSSRTLYYSQDMEAVHSMYPHLRNDFEDVIPPDARFVASEPFTEGLDGAWVGVGESSAIVVRRGAAVEHREFAPVAPVASASVA
jgi:glutamine amidotransferase